MANNPEVHAAFKQGMENFLNQNKDQIYSGMSDFISDQLMTKEEKEAKSKKKREEIEERERKERESSLPTLADLFNRFSGSGEPVKMAQPDYYKEHRNVVGLLNRTGKALMKEAKDQKEEATAMAKKMGARNPFFHMRGAGFGPDGEYIPPTIEDIKKHYDKPIQPPPVFDDEPEELMMQRYYYSQKAPGKYRPDKKRGGAFEPGRVVPGEFQANPFDDWIENERRTTNPFYHLAGAGDSVPPPPPPPRRNPPARSFEDDSDIGEDLSEESTDDERPKDVAGPAGERAKSLIEKRGRRIEQFTDWTIEETGRLSRLPASMRPVWELIIEALEGLSGLLEEIPARHFDRVLTALKKSLNLSSLLAGSSTEDEFMNVLEQILQITETLRRSTLSSREQQREDREDADDDDVEGAGFLDDIGRLADGISRNKPLTDILGKAGNFLADHAADALIGSVFGGIAHNPKGHTTRNNNLTKQKPQKKKFCGFVAKKFEHKDYDPAKMHKFRAATCGGPLSHGGRPTGAKNKEGYVKSGEFTERRKQYGESREFRKRIMGQGRQLQLMPDEDDLVSKKENPVVEKIIHEPMDDGDIRAYFPKARVMRYAELADYEDIEELLPSDKSHVFLLYQHRPNDGHFVCLMRYGKTIEFFCSYGSKIDGPLYWTALKDRQALGEGKPYLSLLLRKAGKRFKAVHNPVAFQSKKQGVATCGAYCVMRINQLVNHNQDLHEFIDWMEEIKKETELSYDEIAANYVNKR